MRVNNTRSGPSTVVWMTVQRSIHDFTGCLQRELSTYLQHVWDFEGQRGGEMSRRPIVGFAKVSRFCMRICRGTLLANMLPHANWQPFRMRMSSFKFLPRRVPGMSSLNIME